MNENNNEKILEVVKESEVFNKRFLRLETNIGLLSMALTFVLILIAILSPIELWLRILLISIGLLQFLLFACVAVYIEAKTGYYECPECKTKFVPKFLNTFFAPHMGTTRFMKCPHCKKRHWNKKTF